jgi:hypothetical protein
VDAAGRQVPAQGDAVTASIRAQWRGDGIAYCHGRADAAEEAYDALMDRTTGYARAILATAKAWRAAAEAFAATMDRYEGEDLADEFMRRTEPMVRREKP